MNRIQSFAAFALIAVTISPSAFGQSTPAAQAARLQRLQAQQAAILARAKAAQAQAAAAAAANTAATPPPIVPPPPVVTAARTATPPVVTPPPVITAPPPTAATTAPPATSAAPATSASAKPVLAATHPDTTAIALDIAALRKSRPERRHAEFLDMQSRWGGLLSDARSNDELKLHAQRLAYLQRIRALSASDPAFVKSVDALITKEETRDSDALNALRSGALPTTPAAVAPAPAAPVAGATK